MISFQTKFSKSYYTEKGAPFGTPHLLAFKRPTAVLADCRPASFLLFVMPALIFGIALIRAIFSRSTSSALSNDPSADRAPAFFHSARRHQMTASRFRQSQFPAVIHHLFHRHSRLFCNLRKFRSRKSERSHLLPGGIKRSSLKNTVHSDAIPSDIPFNTQWLHRLPPFLCPGWHRPDCNIFWADRIGGGRRTLSHTPGRFSPAPFSSFPASDGYCST